jgi:hypothetical protein
VSFRQLSLFRFALISVFTLSLAEDFGNANPCVDAATIDNHLQAHGSPMAGLGPVFIEAGASYRVDPRLLVAIAGQETGYGKHLAAPMNAFNWFYTSPPSSSDFQSFEQAITETARGLRDHFWDTYHETSIQLLAQGSKPYTTTQQSVWVANVTSIYQSLGGDINDLSYACSSTYSVFFDDAEAARGSNWASMQGAWQTTTSPSTEPWFSLQHAWRSGVPSNSNNSLASNSIDLRGLSNISLTFWHRYAISGNGWLNVWIKPQDGNFVQVGSYSNGTQTTWQRSNVNLNQFSGRTIQIFFQLYTSAAASGDGWFIDNILIAGSQGGQGGSGATSTDYDDQARRDMIARAAQDSRFGLPIPSTFGSNLEWIPDFELRWMAFNVVGNRTAFVYQARHKPSGNRFTTYFDPDSGQQVPWEQSNVP